MITNYDVINCWNALPLDDRKKILIKFGIQEGENPLSKNELKKYLEDHYISMRGKVVTK